MCDITHGVLPTRCSLNVQSFHWTSKVNCQCAWPLVSRPPGGSTWDHTARGPHRKLDYLVWPKFPGKQTHSSQAEYPRGLEGMSQKPIAKSRLSLNWVQFFTTHKITPSEGTRWQGSLLMQYPEKNTSLILWFCQEYGGLTLDIGSTDRSRLKGVCVSFSQQLYWDIIHTPYNLTI